MRDDYAIDRITDATAYDSDGEKVGTAKRVFADDATAEPTFVTVSTGLFGTSETIVPLEGARMKGEELHLAYPGELIKDAPRVDEDGELASGDEEKLSAHYGRPEPEDAGEAGAGDDDSDTSDADADEDEPETGGKDADAGVDETAEPGAETREP